MCLRVLRNVNDSILRCRRSCGLTRLLVLVDEPSLCGAFCVWLTKDTKETRWLSGRFLSARWDVEELMGKKEEVIEKDLLKMRMTVS